MGWGDHSVFKTGDADPSDLTLHQNRQHNLWYEVVNAYNQVIGSGLTYDAAFRMVQQDPHNRRMQVQK